jgi:hypothetical protein
MLFYKVLHIEGRDRITGNVALLNICWSHWRLVLKFKVL